MLEPLLSYSKRDGGGRIRMLKKSLPGRVRLLKRSEEKVRMLKRSGGNIRILGQ